MTTHAIDSQALIAEAKTIFHDSGKSDRNTIILNASVSKNNPDEAVVITTMNTLMGHAGEFIVNVHAGTVERRY